jgi:hypothetical protein
VKEAHAYDLLINKLKIIKGIIGIIIGIRVSRELDNDKL